MELQTTVDVEEYADAVIPFLEAEPCLRNVLRWVIELARSRMGNWSAPPLFMWSTRDGDVTAAAHWSPPYPLFASDGAEHVTPSIVEAVARHAHQIRVDVTAINGPTVTASTIAQPWAARTGKPARLNMSETMYELTRVSEPPQPEGTRRPAVFDDVAMLAEWLRTFSFEVGVTVAPDPEAAVRSRVERGTWDVWEDDGTITSMCGFTQPPLAGVVRIGPVYTPPKLRGRGYARRLTAEVSQSALDGGAMRCTLFADAANPVSNSIYRQIGYVPRHEIAGYRFDAE